MRVLVADRLAEESLDELRALGAEVRYEPSLDADTLRSALTGVGVLIVRGTRVDARTLAAGDALNLVIRAGAGSRNIDVAEASRRGVYVATCPGKNASAVAELTFTLLGSLDRRVPDAVASLRTGAWEKDDFARATGLRGRRLGVLGLGHVGRAVARLGKAYGMHVSGWSRSLSRARAQELEIGWAASPLELARGCDVLTVHLELCERTRGVVDRAVLEALPDGALLVNTARAELVDHDALLELVPKKRLRVGLDVLPSEPDQRTAQYAHPLLELRGPDGLVYATPHIGASTDEAQIAIANETVRIARAFLLRGEVPNVINVSAGSHARFQLVLRHRDHVGALANALSVLKRHGLHIRELENTLFDGGVAACARISLASRPSEACLAEISAFDAEVLHVDCVQLPNLA